MAGGEKFQGTWLQLVNLSVQPQLELEVLDLMARVGLRKIVLEGKPEVCSH